MLLYAHTLSPRLRYIVQWFQEHYLTEPIELTDSLQRFQQYPGAKISYTAQRMDDRSCWIEPALLLFEDSVRPQSIEVSNNGNFPIFFCGKGDMGFDVWSAAFYLISRYEEYLPHRSDEYGRYAPEQSLACRHGFLQRPIVDEWMLQFCQCLVSYFPELSIRENRFQYLATYDIDESYAYRYKSTPRQLGGLFRDLLQGRTDWLVDRLKTIFRIQPDPYDAYEFIQRLHESRCDRPIFFFHVGDQVGKYDKNLSPHHSAQKRLIRSLAIRFDIGLHPSWRSGDQPSLLNSEKQTLDQIVGWWVTASRQHYIRFQLPDTYNYLLDIGITDDHSMGYASVNGFRAGTSRSFFWFNLHRNQATSLRLHPFCYMDANSFFELGQSLDQAESDWRSLEQVVRRTNGTMITIWHNSFLGTSKRFAGWRERYKTWMETLPSQIPSDSGRSA